MLRAHSGQAHRQRGRDRDRQTEAERERERDRQRETERGRERGRERQRETEAEAEKDRDIERSLRLKRIPSSTVLKVTPEPYFTNQYVYIQINTETRKISDNLGRNPSGPQPVLTAMLRHGKTTAAHTFCIDRPAPTLQNNHHLRAGGLFSPDRGSFQTQAQTSL